MILSVNMNCREYIIRSISGRNLVNILLYKETCATKAIKTTTKEDLSNTSKIGHEVSGNMSPYTEVFILEGIGPWTKVRSILRRVNVSVELFAT